MEEFPVFHEGRLNALDKYTKTSQQDYIPLEIEFGNNQRAYFADYISLANCFIVTEVNSAERDSLLSKFGPYTPFGTFLGESIFKQNLPEVYWELKFESIEFN